MSAIICFLEYNPTPAANTLAERSVRQRTSLGLSQKESARQLGVDPSTLAKWEQRNREPAGEFLGRAKRFLSAEASSVGNGRQDGMIGSGEYLVAGQMGRDSLVNR